MRSRWDIFGDQDRMQAALVTAGLHAIFQTHGRTASSLRDAVTAANRYLSGFLPGTSFVTLAALVLDPQTGEGACVNCGHPPMLAATAAGEIREIAGGDNLPLGVGESPIESNEFRLRPGERVVGYTDGLTELRDDAGAMLGLRRLTEQVGSICRAGPAAAANVVAERIDLWLEGYRGTAAAGDDRTLLVAQLPTGPE